LYILLSVEILLTVLLFFLAGRRYDSHMKILSESLLYPTTINKNLNYYGKAGEQHTKSLSVKTIFANDKSCTSIIFLPIGLHFLKLINHKFSSKYEGRLELKLKNLSGPGQSRKFLEIHMAKKINILLFTSIFITFVATQIKIDKFFIVYWAAILLLLFYITDKQLDKQIKERKQKMQIEFPEFLNKLVLLVDAGLSVQVALRKIIRDNKKINPLYTELGYTLNDINSGKSEAEAFELFARRCCIHEITAFTAALLQNIKKGNREFVPILRVQAVSCWENRKNIARKLGEEASTKLVFPMIITFIAILIMAVTPALFQINF